MELTLKNGTVYRDGMLCREGVTVSSPVSSPLAAVSAMEVDIENLVVLPGFVDVHVHLREPGFLYKETIFTGTRACARGGYTTVFSMPNLSPVPDTFEHLKVQLDAIRKDAAIRVLPYGSITVEQKGEKLSDLAAMAPYVCAFSDDGKGVQDKGMMKEAMQEAKRLGKLIVAHCEDNSLLFGGYIHDGEYCKAHGHKGICSESEWRPIARDLELAAEVGVGYHVCHVSARESVEIIRQAKKSGVDVTCETGPHYLLMDDSMLQEEGRFKMNPPIRGKADRNALLEGLCDGTVDMVATDHAPHSAEEKAKGLAGSAMGIVGIETAFPLLYTHLVKEGVLSLETLVERMHGAPCRRFGLKQGIETGDFTVFDLNREYAIDPEQFLSKGRATPFAGWKVSGACRLTVCGGRIAYNDGLLTL